VVGVREAKKNGRPTNETAAQNPTQVRYQSTGCKDCGAVANAGTLDHAKKCRVAYGLDRSHLLDIRRHTAFRKDIFERPIHWAEALHLRAIGAINPNQYAGGDVTVVFTPHLDRIIRYRDILWHPENQLITYQPGTHTASPVSASDAASQVADRIVPLRWLGYAGPHGGGK